MTLQKVGRSEFTALKQQHLGYVLDCHFKISKAIMKKNKWIRKDFFYADIFAGDGGEETEGSPVIFEEINKKHNLVCNPVFIEENPVTVQRLKRKIHYPVINARNEDVLPKLVVPKNQIGLIYVDPNGDVPFKQLETFCQNPNTRMIDILIYYSATTIKRALKSSRTNRDISLVENIKRLPKKHWLIRNTTGKFQWSFLFGTNYTNFPEFKKIGFFKTCSLRGQAILQTANYTAHELKKIKINIPEQLSLFN